MSLDTWSGRNELLNEFHAAIHRRTHGRLSAFALDVIDGVLVLEARTETYYAVQLALSEIQAFTAEFPKLTPAKMSFRVNGHPLVLANPHAGGNGQAADNDDPFENSDSMLPVRHADEQSPSSLMSSAVATAAT
jgi:hypothetical protein